MTNGVQLDGSRWRRISLRAVLGVLMAALPVISGCGYSDVTSASSGIAVRETVRSLQETVGHYQEDNNGLLPIQNANETDAIYEKYKVDFGKLKRLGYISGVPAPAYESGGSYVFLIIDEETKPTVRALDLPVFQAAGDIGRLVQAYRSRHNGELPGSEEVSPGYYYINYKMLGISDPKLHSMFSRQPLSLMMDDKGRVYADYASDIATAIRKSGAVPNADEDLRHYLSDASDYVPVKSPVYRWVNEAPQAAPSV